LNSLDLTIEVSLTSNHLGDCLRKVVVEFPTLQL